MDFAPNFTPNGTLSLHLLTIIFICHVYFGIKLYAQLALIKKIGKLLLFQSSVENIGSIISWVHCTNSTEEGGSREEEERHVQLLLLLLLLHASASAGRVIAKVFKSHLLIKKKKPSSPPGRVAKNK